MPTSDKIKNAQNDIEQTLTEFKQLFSAIFFKKAANKLKSIPPHEAEQIFNDLWAQMEAGSLLGSKEALDHYFNTIKTETIQLKKHQKKAPQTSTSPIAKSCEAMTMRLNWLHRSGLTEMFTQMISIYHWLANKRLFLDKIEYYQALHLELSRANEQLQRKHNAIDLVCQRFLATMTKRRHLLSQAEWSMLEKNPLALIDDQSLQAIEEIERKLTRIPTSNKINELLKLAKDQGGISDDGRIKAQARSRFLLKIAQDVKKLAEQFAGNYKGVPCHEPTVASNLLPNELMRMTANLGAAAFETTNINPDIQALATACGEKGDNETAAKIARWTEVSASLAVFQHDYAQDYANEVNVSAKTLTHLIEKIEMEKNRHQNLELKISMAEQLFENALQCMHDLSQHCEVISKTKPEETIGYFLKRNWGKMLIAGVLAAGAATALGILFVPGVLVIAAIVVGAFVVGSSLGLVGGVVAEKTAAPVDLTDKEVESFLGYDTMPKLTKPKITLETSVPLEAEQEQVVEAVAVKKAKVANSVFAFFPTAERVKQASAQIGGPPPAKPERQSMQRGL